MSNTEELTKPGTARAAGLNVAIAGCAHIHVPAYVKWLRAHPEISVLAAGDDDQRRAVTVAEELGTTVRPVDEIWSLPKLDAVLIISETSRHHAYIQEATERDLHVFVEKPLAITSQDAHLIAKNLEQAKVLSHVGFSLRQHPAFRKVREVVQAGSLGTITRARASVAHDGLLRDIFRDYAWMTDADAAGFGGFGDMAAHGIDLMLWLFGTDVEAVTGAMGRIPGAPPAPDHFGECMIRFGDGLIATVASSWVDKANPVMLEVIGTDGVIQVEGNAVRAYGFDLDEEPPATGTGPSAALDAFVRAVLADPRDAGELVSPGVAAKNVQILEAAYAGAKQDRWITLA